MVAPAPPTVGPPRILSHDELQSGKRPDDWAPNSPQQVRFLSSPAFEALFGGAAGPGKTDCLLMEAARQVWHPFYTGILLRRIFPNLEAANGLIQRSLYWYAALGGQYNGSKHLWTFPSGARIYFGHMQYVKDMLQYQGAEFCFVGFDELTEFERQQYLYLFTRCRVPGQAATYSREHDLPALRAYVRGATNPGNIGHKWVKRRFIAQDITNRIRHFATELVDGLPVDRAVSPDHPDALSRAYYPARLDDNPNADPGYRQRILASGDPVQIARLLDSDWDAEYAEGRIYDTWSSAGWPDGNVSAEATYRPDQPVYLAVDDGYAYGEGPGFASYHPRVLLWLQDNVSGGLDVIDELYVTGETHAETLRTAFGAVDGPPDDPPTRWQAYARASEAYVPSEAAMFRGELHKYGVTTVNSTHRVSEGIRAVRQLIRGGDGVRRLRVHPRCENLIYEMTEYRSDPKGRAQNGEIIPLKIDDHGPDTVRYITFKKRGV